MARDTTWDHWNPPTHRTDPKTILTFGCLPYGKNTTCAEIHPHGPVDPKSGSSLMCACCHVGGKENRPMRAEFGRMNDGFDNEPIAIPPSYKPDLESSVPTKKRRHVKQFQRKPAA